MCASLPATRRPCHVHHHPPSGCDISPASRLSHPPTMQSPSGRLCRKVQTARGQVATERCVLNGYADRVKGTGMVRSRSVGTANKQFIEQGFDGRKSQALIKSRQGTNQNPSALWNPHLARNRWYESSTGNVFIMVISVQLCNKTLWKASGCQEASTESGPTSWAILFMFKHHCWLWQSCAN